jgi:hypothetical protein
MEGFIMKKLLLGIFILAFASYAYAGTEVYIDLLETGAEEHAVYYLNDNQPAGRDLIWDNGLPDEENGLCCQRIGIVNQADVCDDFHLDATTTITGIEWDSVDDATYTWNETDDLEIYPWEGTVPGETPQVSLFNVPNTRESMGTLFSRPWWRYTIALDPADQFDLEAGAYFVLARPYNPGTSGQSFWLTSPAPAGSQSQAYFRAAYWGYYTWTPGDQVFGSEYDVNFRLYGTTGGGVACEFVDPPTEVYVGDRVRITKVYINDTDQECTFEGDFVVYVRGREVARMAHPGVVVAAHSQVTKTYLSPKVPKNARRLTLEVCNEGVACGMDYSCCFKVKVL